MKITNVNYSNDSSGASIAVKRINQMFLKNGFDSQILSFLNSKSKNKFEITLRNFAHKILQKIQQNIFDIRIPHSTNFGFISSNFYKKINTKNSEIVNLHWIGNEMMSIKDISKIKGFLIWTLHDMWPYCAIENYTDQKYFELNYSFKKKKLNFFLDFFFSSKIKYFNKIKIVICTSNWQKKMADKSLIFKSAKKILIPLPLDFNLWSPSKKSSIRKKMNIPQNKKVISFILSHRYAAKRKGLDYVIRYLENSKRNDLVLLTINCENLNIKSNKVQHINIKSTDNIQERINFYSVSDIFLMPSLIESFGQTVLEAQACNCPVITFKDTGSEDIVSHQQTGYVANYACQDDFNKGIDWLIDKTFFQDHIRNSAKKKFSYDVIINQYKKHFQFKD